MEIVLKDLLPGDWYQMRVMAYSMNGTNGYSHRSRSIRMNFEIRRPSPPRNITALGAWFHNSKIFVKISWSPPLLLGRLSLTFWNEINSSYLLDNPRLAFVFIFYKRRIVN